MRRAGMLQDRYGLALSTSSQAARDAYVAGADCILSATAGVERHLGRALEADPCFALAQAAHARELAARATPREQAHVNALALAIEGRPAEALEATRAHLRQYPGDA